MMGETVLILGGVKSGKTSFAQQQARAEEQETGRRVLYLATAEALDEEMRVRVQKHRQSRPQRWETIEEPLAPSTALEARLVAPEPPGIVILDCLTLLMTNLILRTGDPPSLEESQEAVEKELERLFDVLERGDGSAYIISNMVETGLISANKLGRLFQEIAGRAHQYAAGRCSSVYRMTAGLPERLK